MHGEEHNRPDMITILGQLADAALLEAFVTDIVVRTYDGSENEALAANVGLLGARRAGELFSNLARVHVPSRRGECVDLLSRLVHEQGQVPDSTWLSGLRNVAAAIIEALQNGRNAPLRLIWVTGRGAHTISGEPLRRMRRWWSRFSTALRPSMRRTCAAPRVTLLPPPTPLTRPA